jgi:glycosyltransferase involved in cell wall biosynthesis
MISVVIPLYNEADEIESCLRAFTRQTYRGRFEVIVVDNNSSDDSPARVWQFAVTHPKMEIRLIHEGKQGVSAASQAGFAHAQYPIIARTDADTVVADDWLEVIEQRFHDAKVAALCGRVGFRDPRPLQKWLLFEQIIAFHQKVHILIKKPHFWGFNFAVRKEVFQRTGGFDTRLRMAEDLDLALRIQESLYSTERIDYADDMQVFSSSRRYTPDQEWWNYTVTGYKSYFQRAWLGRISPWMCVTPPPDESRPALPIRSPYRRRSKRRREPVKGHFS